MNNISTKSVRDVKVKGLKFIEQKYDTDIHIYNEHGINGDNLPRGSTFDGLMADGGKSKYIFAYNTHDKEYQGVHQPGGTAVRVTGAMTQYVRKRGDDMRGLGRYCSIALWENPAKKCRFVSVYNIAKASPRV